MGKQRDAVRMSETEIAEFMASSQSLQVATLDPEGAPHLTTLWFAMHGECPMFETYGKSQKVMNLRRDPRIAVLCEAGTSYDQLRGVSIQGRAELVEENPRLLELMRELVNHHFAGMDPQQLERTAAQMAEKRIVVVVLPEKTMSWDHRKLAKG